MTSATQRDAHSSAAALGTLEQQNVYVEFRASARISN